MSTSEQYRPSLDDPTAWVPYRYHPSLPAAAVLAAAFSVMTIVHVAYLFRARGLYSMVPMVVGGVFELAGFIGRTLSTNDIWALGPYIVQSILLLVAPALFAASIYMILGRVIRSVDGGAYSLVPLKWLTKIFVGGDVVAFLLQMGGGGIQAGGTLELLHLGDKIIIAGLFAQIVFFALFIVVATVFQYRYSKHIQQSNSASNWKRIMFSLYAGSGLIMFRSIFRVIEYLMGNNGFLLRHEYFLYIFDAVPMVLLLVLFVIIHPSHLRGELNESEKIDS